MVRNDFQTDLKKKIIFILKSQIILKKNDLLKDY